MQTAPLTSHLAAWKWWIIAAVVIGALWATDRLRNGDTLPEQIAWEDSPFYARSALKMRMFGHNVMAVQESISLDRLINPVVQFMLPYRMPRRTR